MKPEDTGKTDAPHYDTPVWYEKTGRKNRPDIFFIRPLPEVGLDLPTFASRAQWVARGFKVREGERYRYYAKIWNIQSYWECDIFHLEQCDPIRGSAAAQRRWHFRRVVEHVFGELRPLFLGRPDNVEYAIEQIMKGAK